MRSTPYLFGAFAISSGVVYPSVSWALSSRSSLGFFCVHTSCPSANFANVPSVALSFETDFRIRSSSNVIIVGNISDSSNAPVFGDIRLLYDSAPRRTASDVLIGGKLRYMDCPAKNFCGALRIFRLRSFSYRLCDGFIHLSAPRSIVATRNSNRGRSTSGVVAAVASVGSAVGLSNVVGPWGRRDSTKLKGSKFVARCT